MKKLSKLKLSETVSSLRRKLNMTQQQLSEKTKINRAIISRIEQQDFMPSIEQLESLSEVLGFDITELFIDTSDTHLPPVSPLNIAVAGAGYVGLSMALLLSRYNHVTAVDINEERVNLINQRKSPIKDDYIELFFKNEQLDLTATCDAVSAYKDADYVIIATPTNYDSKRNYFDTSAVEDVIKQVIDINPNAIMVIKSTIPVGYTELVRARYNSAKIIFSPEFLRESIILDG